MSQKDRIRMAAMMGRYVDQSISFNVYLEEPSNAKYATLMTYAHECDLKTGNYYHRSQPATDAKKVVVSAEEEPMVCQRGDPYGCISCTA